VLTRHHYDAFRLDFNDPYIPPGLVTFRLDADGQAAGFTFRIQSNDFNFDNLRFVKSSVYE